MNKELDNLLHYFQRFSCRFHHSVVCPVIWPPRKFTSSINQLRRRLIFLSCESSETGLQVHTKSGAALLCVCTLTTIFNFEVKINTAVL